MAIKMREALDILSLSYSRLMVEGAGARFADEVISRMWIKYPWKQSIAKLPPFYMNAYESDYGPPTQAVPSDFFGLHDAWLKNIYHYEKPLGIVHDLKPSIDCGEPDAICYLGETGAFRLHPRPNYNPPYYWIEGRYKKKPTRITDLTLNSVDFPFDDLYFHVFRQGMAWKYAQELAKDPAHMQQFLLFMQMLKEMAISESIHQGASTLAPEYGLALGG